MAPISSPRVRRCRVKPNSWAKHHAGAKARRWVVERTHSWLNRFRSILIRWAKKPANYLALLHFALALITWRHALPGYALSSSLAICGG